MTKTTASSGRSTRKTVRTESRAPRVVEIPEDYTPITMWGYFGYEFLFMIPLVGWILCISFAFMAQNHNLRNFARSQFCWLIIYIACFCVLAGVGVLHTVVSAF